MTQENNTLFLLTNWGLHRVDSTGVFESHMWNLDANESSMQYFSMHKSKADRAYRGGKIVDIRSATEAEIEAHQELMKQKGREKMRLTHDRKVVVFQMIRGWNAIWPLEARSNPMAYKGMGFVDVERFS